MVLRRVILLGMGLVWFAACTQPATSTPQPSAMPTLHNPVATAIPATPMVTPWRLATVAPSGPIPSPTPPCVGAPPTRIIVGEHGIVSDDDLRPLNVRAAPGTDNRILGRLQAGEAFLVLDGPQCSGEYVWYYIERGDLDGWIAEGDMGLYYIAPYLSG